jgi:predicted RND superfamily exporter protein
MNKFFKHPWLIVGIIVAITVFFALQLPKAEMDNNTVSFLPRDNPARLIARHFEEEYGDSIVIMVGLERSYGTVFEKAFLSRIREFTDAVEAVGLVKKTDSILSTQYITSDSESIIVTDLVDDGFSGTMEELAELKRRIASWDMYRGSLVSDDLSSTQIVVQLNATVEHSGDPEVMAALLGIRNTAKELFSESAEVYTAGQSVVSASLTESAYADVQFLIPLSVVVLLGVLVISFRRFTYVTLPLLTVAVSVIWSIGAMPLFGVRLTLMCMILPVILIAVGSAYGVHLVSHYKDDISGKTFTLEKHREFVFALVRRLIKPVFLAALTTFAGFISFVFAPLTSMRDFGIFSSLGVLVAFLAAVTLIPAVLIIRGPRAVKLTEQKKMRQGAARADTGANVRDLNKFLSSAMTNLVNRKKTLVLAVTALIVVVSIVGSARIVADNSMIEFFNPASEVNRSDRFIREHFGGSTQIIVSVEAEHTETLLHPQTLAAAEDFCAYLRERVPHVGKVTGFPDLIKRMNQMFNVDEPPEGIRQTARIANGEINANEDSAFGFGDFGFDDFGFDTIEGGAPPTLQPPAGAPAPATPPASPETPVTFAMLTSAVGKNAGISAEALVRELERLTNYEGYSYYEIPSDPAKYGKETEEELGRLVANYLVLLAGDADEGFSNDPLEPTAFEIVVLVNSKWQADTNNVVNAINRYVAANFPKNVTVLVGGGAMQEGAISALVLNSQIVSIFITVLIVFLIVAFSNKSAAAGLISALPLSITILCNFAVMGFLHITLNMATALISSLIVGIGIDYTIHFMEAYKREFLAGGDYLYRTYATSGKAILINAVSVGVSFAVIIFSQFRIVGQFGILVCQSMFISAVVSLTVIPVLLETIRPKFIYGKQPETLNKPVLIPA